jgi:hypothetical protein
MATVQVFGKKAKGFEITDDTSNWHTWSLTLRLLAARDQHVSI